GVVRIGGDAINVLGGSQVVNGSMTVGAPVAADLAPAGTTGKITRTDAKTWFDDGFAAGQQVTLTGGFKPATLAFARNGGGDTITRSHGGNWISDGFYAGQTITVAGAGNNNGQYTIKAGGVSAST